MFVDVVSRTFQLPVYKAKSLFILAGLVSITFGLWNFSSSDIVKIAALVLGVYLFFEGF